MMATASERPVVRPAAAPAPAWSYSHVSGAACPTPSAHIVKRHKRAVSCLTAIGAGVLASLSGRAEIGPPHATIRIPEPHAKRQSQSIVRAVRAGRFPLGRLTRRASGGWPHERPDHKRCTMNMIVSTPARARSIPFEVRDNLVASRSINPSSGTAAPIRRSALRAHWSIDPVSGRLSCRWTSDDEVSGSPRLSRNLSEANGLRRATSELLAA